MSIKVAINHKTHYKFDRLVSLSPHVIRLRPAPHCRTKIESYSLTVRPEKHFINWQQDPFGNYNARLVFQEKTKELYVEVDLIAVLDVINPFDFFVDEYAEKFPFKYEKTLQKELGPYLEPTEKGTLLTEWLSKLDMSPKNVNDFLVYVNQKLNKDIAYSIRMEPGVQTCEETLTKALGSCRDTGWLLVQILRHCGLAARFVSGYLVQLTADIEALDGPSGPKEDFTDLHAWCEVFIPGAGWIGLDPTSGLFAGEGHIPLSCTPEPSSAAAISGLLDACESTMEYSNTVTRIFEDSRVTKPYTEEQWAAMLALGYKIDEDLFKNDVRLSMGGEPTFVSIDDMESAQWNTDADGLHKRKLASDLVLRLRDTFGNNGALLHFGQGKWYPGEPLPRWQYTIYWRKDGLPLWKRTDLLAEITKDYKYGKKEALIFADTLNAELGLSSHYIVPAYEDALYYALSEGNIPVNIDPLKKNLKDSIERQYLADILDVGLNNPVGYVIPLEWSYSVGKWLSSTWKLRRKHLFLTPGNSPLGLRLPLDSLEFIAPEDRQQFFEHDLFADLPPLEDYHAKRNTTPFNIVDEPYYIVRTALSIEPRNGRLHIFFPPISYFESYLDLLSVIEKVAVKLGFPVVIEGYDPPKDYRIEKLVVSPDPGVIEVNIHPAQSWGEITKNYEKLFEQARLSRLGTEKFMVDGRHTGTGGGNHITIGSMRPADSPMLRRPDLLRSLITYWQHHPGLSYLFAGPFIGPTSQAPRVDEGRLEKLYELEIAFSQIPDFNSNIPYWLIDRLLRHLLVDITGNTHRAEFCIDKLYSPDSSSGRLGILEFRAFDMPPHYRMCMLQLLLIRGLVSMFWQKPYKGKLIRWGTELHDKFLLPHFCMADLKDVCRDLNEFGYPFQAAWLEPFHEFRFPHYGTTQVDDIKIQLRMAIEPWHVLGEESTSAGTARYVDSSLERIQVYVTGMTPGRHILLCNGKRIPLRNTGAFGEQLAGVRYKAWNPPSSLHPTIDVQSPLIFDLVDTWTKRSVGGCKYFVSHPGGRSYGSFPINSYEAESRRINRFWDFGHTPDTVQHTPVYQSLITFVPEGSGVVLYEVPSENIDQDYPFTLDLRKSIF
jgi:uncharacterized protein (DUF2126 family)/transglutaminase-like putative cysteine protease